jgi:two-component sensor histidine kinase
MAARCTSLCSRIRNSSYVVFKVLFKPNDRIALTVRDDGVGIPVDLDWRNAETLGLKLVTMLVEQLEGTVELDRSTGTAFQVTFPRVTRASRS